MIGALDEIKRQILDCINSAYDKGYKNGLNDGNINDGTFAAKVREAYNNGLNDAEKARTRLVSAVSNGGLSEYELEQIFDLRDYGDVLTEYTISEIIDKIREYDERKQQEELKKACDDEIHVGDEICLNSGTRKYIVTAFLDNGKLFVLEDDGFTVLFDCNEIHKTGRNYPIMEILKKLNQLNESEE